MAKSKGKLPGAVVGKFKAKAGEMPARVKGAAAVGVLLLVLAVVVWLVFGRDGAGPSSFDSAAAAQDVKRSQQRAADGSLTLAETAQDASTRATGYGASASRYIELGDTAKALSYAKQAYEANATDVAVVRQVSYQYATLLAQSGDYAQAVTVLEKLVKPQYEPGEAAFGATLTATLEAYRQQKPYSSAQRCEPGPDKECE